MRLFYKKYTYHEIESDLDQVQNVLSSNTYIFIDLFFISILISMFVAVSLGSPLIGILFFIGCYSIFFLFYSLLLKWLKDPPEEDL
ncbi:MAG TPA: hypothetical protein VNR61_07585 [Niallia sp.]|nr:hypothetical protein [Niallia sp.]